MYTLIERMTKSEKRYFKVSSRKTGSLSQKHYATLFDIILVYREKYNEISETEIKSLFEKQIGKKVRFDLYKQHLFKKLMGLVDVLQILIQ